MTTEPTFPTKLECLEPVVAPGNPLRCVLWVYNPRQEVDEFVVRGTGEAEGWITTEPETLRLLDESDGKFQLVLTVPEAAPVEAGEHVARLHVVSTLSDAPKEVSLAFTLTPVTRLEVAVEPQRQDATAPAVFTVRVHNASNHAVQVQLQAADQAHQLQLQLQPPVLQIAAFRHSTAILRAAPPATSPTESRPYPISVHVATVDPPGHAAKATAQAVLVHQPPPEPLLPRWLIPVAAIAAVALLAGVVVYSVTRGPGNIAPPVIQGAAVVGQTLTVQPGVWDDAEPWLHVWQRCEPDGGSCTDVMTDGSQDLVVGEEYVLGVQDQGMSSRVIELASSEPVDEGTEDVPDDFVEMPSSRTGVVAAAPLIDVTVPDVVGTRLSQARTTLAEVGLKALRVSTGETTKECDPIVVSQAPRPRVTAQPGQTVAVAVPISPIRDCFPLEQRQIPTDLLPSLGE